MYESSDKFKSAMIEDDYRAYQVSCKIQLQNGTILEIDNSNLFDNGFQVEESVSGSSSFEVGTAIINQLTLNLNNIYQEYDRFNFDGAVIRDIKIGLEIDGEPDEVERGIFTVDEAKGSDIITLTCYDNMIKFDRPYGESNLVYPASLLEIVRNACAICGVPLASYSFPNSNFIIEKRPESNELTFREILTYVGQIACVWFKCDTDGHLTAGFYDPDLFSVGAVHSIRSIESIEPFADDITITGVRVKASEEENAEVYFQGSQDYAVSIDGNAFVTPENAESVKNMIAERVIGLRFRPLTLRCLADPTIEAGDCATVYDIRGRVYRTFVTSTTFSMGGQTVSCDAETPLKKNTNRFSATSKIYRQLNKKLEQNKSEVEQAIERLKESLDFSSGLYPVIVPAEGGGNKFYFCDAPTLEAARVIFELNSEGWRMSNDGGETWIAGLMVDGTMITKILDAIGINAEWINTGVLKVADVTGKETLYVNTDTGEVRISADQIKISGKDAEEIAKDAILKYIIEIDPELRIETESDTYGVIRDVDGNYKAFEISTRLMFGSRDVTESSYVYCEKSSSVVGHWDQKRKVYVVEKLLSGDGQVIMRGTYAKKIEDESYYDIISGLPGDDNLHFEIRCVTTDGSYADITLSRNVIEVTCEKIIKLVDKSANKSGHIVVNTSVNSAGLTDTGTYTPDVVVFSCLYDNGESRREYTVNWKYSASKDNAAWKEVATWQKTGTINVNFNAAGTGYKFLKVDAIDRTDGKVLASKTVPVLEDKTEFNANVILEKLSQGWEGIYKDDEGHFYIDATLIKAGQIDGEHINAKNITVRDNSNKITFSINQNGEVTIDAKTLSIGGTAIDKKITDGQHKYTQAEIFNLLTNNGKLEGLFMENGKLYINGTYIQIDDLASLKAKIGGWEIGSSYISTTDFTETKGNSGVSLNANGSLRFGKSTLSTSESAVGFFVKNGFGVQCGNSNGTIRYFTLTNVPVETQSLPLGISGDWVVKQSSSSKRYKNHIDDISLQEARNILDIPVVNFTYKDGYLSANDRNIGKEICGFYAEDIDKIYPKACIYNADDIPEDWNHRTLIPPMLKMIQELSKEVEMLREEINILKGGD